MPGAPVVALQMFLPLQGSSVKVVLPHLRILIPIIALNVLIPLLLPQSRTSLGVVQHSSVLPTQTISKLTISHLSLHIPVSIYLRELDLPRPPHSTSLRLNVSHPHAKYIDLAHASQSLVSARRVLVSPSRRSHLRSIYLAFLLRRPQMTLSCFMVVCDLRDLQSQQMRVKPRCSRVPLLVSKNSCLHSNAVLSISPSPPPM